eukprot:COSAG06_NODE_13972_length_1201_cov_1.095281_2_plen_80_part_01
MMCGSVIVGTWESTGHFVEHAAVEGSAQSRFRCGAIVCHSAHPRLNDYRGDPIPPLIRGLQAEGEYSERERDEETGSGGL